MNFEVQYWHAVLFFFTILIGIFKDDLINILDSIESVREKKFSVNQNIQILSPAGTWEDAIIASYKHKIPFIQTGGITLKHKDSDGNVYEEIITFANWKSQRTRSLDTPLSRG